MQSYVYQLSFPDGSFYFGVRSCLAEDYTDIDYLSSSRVVKTKLEAGEICCREVLCRHESRELANELEHALILQWLGKPGCLNRTAGYATFSVAGLTFGKSTRLKMGEATKVKWTKEEYREKVSRGIKRAHLRNPQRKSETSKAVWTRQSHRTKVKASLQKVQQTQEYRQRLSASVKVSWESDEIRERHSESAKEYWNSLDTDQRNQRGKSVSEALIEKSNANLVHLLPIFWCHKNGSKGLLGTPEEVRQFIGEIGIKFSRLKEVLSGSRNAAKGYQFIANHNPGLAKG